MDDAGLLLSINTSDGGLPKRPRHEAHVGIDGVEGDRQRDRRFHGGQDRAVCLYSFERIRALQTEGHSISVGEAGENLTLLGVDWEAVVPGVQLTVSGVRLLVTSFTVPCRNLSACFDGGHGARISQKAHPGWSRVYARVEQPGRLSIGDPVTLDAAGSSASPRQPAAAGGSDSVPRLSISRTGTVDVACPVAEAFTYFTPDGERLWVPDFDPEYLHPLSGDQTEGAVFTTTHGGERTLWMILRFSPADGVAEYARVTPGSRRGIVRVRVEATGATAARATICYELTALSDSGNDVLAAMTDAAYAEMMVDWQRRIANCRG
jgi:MOSC domain-containing protein YiiM